MWKASRQRVPEREEPSSCQKAQHRNCEQGDSQFLFASTSFRTTKLCPFHGGKLVAPKKHSTGICFTS